MQNLTGRRIAVPLSLILGIMTLAICGRATAEARPSALAVNPAQSNITCGQSAEFLVTVDDPEDPRGALVTASTSLGSISPESAVTDTGGTIFVLTTGPTDVGTATVRFSAGDLSALATVDVTCPGGTPGGFVVCAFGIVLPDAGYVVTAKYENYAECGRPLAWWGFNAVRLSPVSDGVVVCVALGWGITIPHPPGYVVTAKYEAEPACGGRTLWGFNAVRLSTLSDGVVACVALGRGITIPRPPGYVVTARYEAEPACGGRTSWGFNAVRLNPLSDGVVACIIASRVPRPPGYVLTWVHEPACGAAPGVNAVRLTSR